MEQKSNLSSQPKPSTKTKNDSKEKKVNQPFIKDSELLDFLEPQENFRNYQTWLEQFNSKIAAIAITLERINQLRSDQDSKMYSADLSLKKLRHFVVYLVDQMAQAIDDCTTPSQDLPDIFKFIKLLDKLLNDLKRITPFSQVNDARHLRLGSLLLAVAHLLENSKRIDIARLPKLKISDLLHSWWHYDRAKLAAKPISQAIYAMGFLAEKNLLIRKNININPFLTEFEKYLSSVTLEVIQYWLSGLGNLAKNRLLTANISADHINSLLTRLARKKFKGSESAKGAYWSAKEAYWGFVKLLNAWAISSSERIDVSLINKIFTKFFPVKDIPVSSMVYMVNNFYHTLNYLPSIENIPYPVLSECLEKLVNETSTSKRLEQLTKYVGISLLSTGEIIRYQGMYGEIGDRDVENTSRLISYLASLCSNYAFDEDKSETSQSKDLKIFVSSTIRALYGLTLMGICNSSDDTLKLAGQISNFLEKNKQLFPKNYIVLVSQLAWFLFLNLPKETSLPPFIINELEANKPLMPKRGSIQARIIELLQKANFEAKPEKLFGPLAVDIYFKSKEEDGLAGVIDLNGGRHHFKNPIKGQEKDLFKSYYLSYVRKVPVHYYDYSDRVPNPSEIVDGIVIEQNDSKKSENKQKDSKQSSQHLYQYIAERSKANKKKWEKGITDSKVAVGTYQPPKPVIAFSQTESEVPYVPSDIEDIPEKKKETQKKSPKKYDRVSLKQLMGAIESGDLSKVKEINENKEVWPLHPSSQKTDPYIFTVGLMLAMQKEQDVAAGPLKTNLQEIITFLADKSSLKSLYNEEEVVCPLILATKWENKSRNVKKIICDRLLQGKIWEKIKWGQVQSKANSWDKSINYRDLLKAPADVSEEKLKPKSADLNKPHHEPKQLSEIFKITPQGLVETKDVYLPRLFSLIHHDSMAQFILGKKYLLGENLERDIEQGLYWLELAATQGEIHAIEYLAAYYFNKNQIEPSVEDASNCLKWVKLGNEKQSLFTLFILAECHLLGIGVEKDIAKALNQLEELSDMDFVPAQRILGYVYTGYLEENFDKALEYLHKADDQIEPIFEKNYAVVIKYHLGDIYYDKKNFDKAIQYYSEAIKIIPTDTPDDRALKAKIYLILGEAYGNMGNEKQAVACFNQAMQNGSMKAHIKLGTRCEKSDSKRAKVHYQIAAHAGDTEARGLLEAMTKNETIVQGWLEAITKNETIDYCDIWVERAAFRAQFQAVRAVVRYYEAVGRSEDPCSYLEAASNYLKDYGLAIQHYEKTVKTDVEAQYNLGCLYYGGSTQDDGPFNCVDLFNEAATQGKIEAYAMLGNYYQQKGELNKAIYYYTLVKEKSDKEELDGLIKLFAIDLYLSWAADQVTDSKRKSATKIPGPLLPILQIVQQTLDEKQHNRGRYDAKELDDPKDAVEVFLELYSRISKVKETEREPISSPPEPVPSIIAIQDSQAEEKKIKPEKDSAPANFNPISHNNKEQLAELKMVEIDNAGAQYKSALQFLASSNFKEAMKLFKSAAEQGHALAQIELGKGYQRGKGVAEDKKEAVYWYEQAEAKGCPEAHYHLGICYEFGQGVKKDLPAAIDQYRKAAEQSVPYGQYFLGLCYAGGKGVETDINQAVGWIQKAAELNCEEAINKLIIYHFQGIGVDKSLVPVVQAARKGSAEHQYILGLSYAGGIGVPQISILATRCFSTAAAQGHVLAQYNLGYCHENGIGIPPDAKQAVKWYQAAANQGFAAAQYSLGRCYAEGIGELKKDEQEAIICYRKAAEQGHVAAQAKLREYTLAGKVGVDKGHQSPSFGAVVSELSSPIHPGQFDAEELGDPKEEAEDSIALSTWPIDVKKTDISSNSTPSESIPSVAAVQDSQAEEKKIKPEKDSAPVSYSPISQGNEEKLTRLFALGCCYAEGIGVPQDFKEAVKYYRKVAEGGFPPAQYKLAIAYYLGQGIEKDLEKSVKWYQKAAEQGHVEAQFFLGQRYEKGEGIAQDQQEAVKWYQAAANQGHRLAQFFLGQSYEKGEGIAQDQQEAVKWYQAAANQGLSLAQFFLGQSYEKGEGIAQDQQEAVKWYQKAANQGHLQAQFLLGVCYEFERGVTKDLKQAMHWFKQAADQGMPEAQRNVGLYYESGKGGPTDLKQAMVWYQRAAEQGFSQAQLNLAICYQAEGITKDEKQAFHWYQKAAERSLPEAQYRLGLCYADGIGVAKDTNQAIKCLQKAVELNWKEASTKLAEYHLQGIGVDSELVPILQAAHEGSAKAQYILALYYAQGTGVPQDSIQARRWLLAAANQGHVPAQHNLGHCHENGIGTPSDAKQAVQWYKAAADQGSAAAQYNLGRCYADGIDELKKPQKAILWYQKAAEQGHAAAQTKLREYALPGVDVDKAHESPSFGAILSKLSSPIHHTKPKHILLDQGLFYAEALGDPKEEEKEEDLFALSTWPTDVKGADIKPNSAAAQDSQAEEKKIKPGKDFASVNLPSTPRCSEEELAKLKFLAEGNNPAAQFEWACLLLISSKNKEAMQWFEKAAKQGMPDAQLNLGVLYRDEKDFKQAATWFEIAAQNNVLEAQFQLGCFYEKGIGVSQNFETAVEWYRKAAEGGFPSGYYNLAIAYQNGEGVARNLTEAMNCYHEAAKQGHVEAQFILGQRYEKRYKTRKNIADQQRAVYWYEKAANQGHRHAQFLLGLRYEKGEGVAQDQKLAAQWYQAAAKQGHSHAQFLLGQRYEKGEGIAQDKKLAVQWYRAAANQEHLYAQFCLGVCYELEIGVTQDLIQAKYWFMRAAERDMPEAQHNVGLYYESGKGGPTDVKQAMVWYKRAAEQGFSQAQLDLAICCHQKEEEGITKDEKQAFHWYQKAAEQSLPKAQFYLGVCYEFERGVTKDLKQAMHWFKQAADQGMPEAQRNVGLYYESGKGGPTDLKQAMIWYQKAAEQGFPQAQLDLAICYQEGITKDEGKALHWYRKAAEQSLPGALYHLGLCYAEGIGVAQDTNQAIEWLQKAVELNCKEASAKLAEYYSQGIGVDAELVPKLQAAHEGSAEAQYILGLSYAGGTGILQSSILATRWFLAAANQGHVPAQYNLGYCHENGIGTPPDAKQAVKWYHAAADQGSAAAQYNLGRCYAEGIGELKDPQKAILWYRKAVEQGNVAAQAKLREYTLAGGVSVDKAHQSPSFGAALPRLGSPIHHTKPNPSSPPALEDSSLASSACPSMDSKFFKTS